MNIPLKLKRIGAVLVCVGLACLIAGPTFARSIDEEIDVILSVAESLFTKLKEREHKVVWGLLTEKTRRTIVNDTDKSLADSASNYSHEQIAADFESGGPIAMAYWRGFLQTFDPDYALKQSTWSMGLLKNDRAEIKLLYKRSENPALVKMFKEYGFWKVGLVESFWSRK